MAPVQANGNVSWIGAVAVAGTTAIHGVANFERQNGNSTIAGAVVLGPNFHCAAMEGLGGGKLVSC
jgi:hypothetical protein